MIVALKGLGGFHLACDATSPTAVQRLRDRKRRERKPLAVMVRDLAQAEAIARCSRQRARAAAVGRAADRARRAKPRESRRRVSAATIPLVGIFLPYTPLHHLLLREAGVPLVMTSGNLSDEPMVDDERRCASSGSATSPTSSSLHDRDIVTRVDDSVVRVIDGAPAVLRRARGYVPRAIEIVRAFAEPILACGAHLKNTFCIASRQQRVPRPAHRRPRERRRRCARTKTAIERMKEFVGVAPSVLAHDLHPDYFSTRYALAQDGVRTIAVQHHHAHIASAMAEHGIEGPVVGIAYDGTGFGTDGTSWGGEILIADYEGFERFATFRPIPLAGGDQAIRQPWRIALALLDDAFDGEPPLHAIPLFRRSPRRGDRSRAPDDRARASTRRPRAASAATSTPSARSSSACPTRATRARWRSAGT